MLDIEKIKQIATYFAEKIPNLYKTKFLKLMYYFDFISVLERGTPVSNDNYYHLTYGPIPSFIKDQVDILVSGNISENIEGDNYDIKSIFSDVLETQEIAGSGTILKVKSSVSSMDYNYISEYEKGLLDDIVNEFKDKSTKSIIAKTHTEAPYQQTPENNVIDYRLAFYLDRPSILPRRSFVFNVDVSQAEFLNAK